MTEQRPHTPEPIIAAVHALAEYLRAEHYGSVVVTPGGGASFHIRNVLSEKDDLYRALEAERRAREIAQADVQALVSATRAYLQTRTFLSRGALDRALAADHPGAHLLAVLDTARAAVLTQSIRAYAELAAAVADHDADMKVSE